MQNKHGFITNKQDNIESNKRSWGATKVLILQDFSLSIFELLHMFMYTGFYVHTVNIQTQIACFAAHAKLTIYRLHFPILFSGEKIIIIYKLKKYGDF